MTILDSHGFSICQSLSRHARTDGRFRGCLHTSKGNLPLEVDTAIPVLAEAKEEIHMKTTNKRAIVLRLAADTVDRIDAVRHELRMDRTAWLRKAVRSQLEHALRNELPLMQNPDIRRALQP
jgi:hypothetical protein